MCLLEYGNAAGKDGYWSYDHMVLQCKDILDMSKAKFEDKYDYLFLFDHSCGHDKKQPDGLNVKKMNSGYGGKQVIFHDSNIKKKEGYLVDFSYDDDCQLKVGDTQRFYFTESDSGPFWLSAKERLEKNDKVDGMITRDKIGPELVRDIVNAGYIPRGKVKDLKIQAKNLQIPLQVVEENVKKGWFGKEGEGIGKVSVNGIQMGCPKGMKQVLYERRFIDKDKLKLYSIDGPQDINGNLIDEAEMSRTAVMATCIEQFTLR